MTRILMRGGKSPFRAISYEDTLHNNVLGTNSGNLIFAEATWRMLSVAGAKIKANGYQAKPHTASKINDSYDVMVLPFANAFRKSFLPHLHKFTALVEQLKIPVVVTGVGAQAQIDAGETSMDAMRDDVRDFCKAVLNRSASIGVRGEYTYDFLRSLGFADEQVDIIGCPSMFFYGPEFPQITKNAQLDPGDKVSMNVSPYVPGIAEIFERNYTHYPKLTYVPQNNESLDQILWDGTFLEKRGKVFPKTTDHSVFREDRVRFFIDTTTWIDHLAQYDFVFGTRIHGNVMGLLSGTPSFVMAHDSRTLELARYFEIPHLAMKDIPADVLARDLYAQADYGPMLAGHQARFETWATFLEKNGLRHVYMPNEDRGAAFDARRRATIYPPEMPTLPFQSAAQARARTAWSPQKIRKQVGTIRETFRSMLKRLSRS